MSTKSFIQSVISNHDVEPMFYVEQFELFCAKCTNVIIRLKTVENY